MATDFVVGMRHVTVPEDPWWPTPTVTPTNESYGIAVKDAPFQELLERLAPEARNFLSAVAIEMLIPLWDLWIEDWHAVLDRMPGTVYHYAITEADVRAGITWPQRLLCGYNDWFRSTGEHPFTWGMSLTDHFNNFRNVIYALHRGGPAGERVPYPPGWYSSLMQGEWMWNTFGWFAQALDHDARDDLTEARYHELTINRTRNGLASAATIFGWKAEVDRLKVRRARDPQDGSGTLLHPDREDARREGLEHARLFYQQWWAVCRARLAFRDAPAATFETDLHAPVPTSSG